MFKKFLFSLLVAQSVGCANHFKGVYLGGFSGTEGRVTQYNYKENGGNQQDLTYRVGHLFGLFARYGHVFSHNFYFGCEVYGFGSTRNGSSTLRDQNNINATKVTYKRGIVTGIAPIFGHLFSEDTLGYAKLGLEVSKDKVSYALQNGTLVQNKTVFAFAPGFGLDHHFNHHIVAGMDYAYSIGQKIKTTEQGAELTTQRRSHQVMFRLAYKI